MFRLTLKPRNLDAFLRKLANDAEPIMGEPWREMLAAVGSDAERIVRSGAPRASGKLASSIRSRVSKSPRPTWVKIEETATRSSRRYRRYPYPRRLEYDASRGHAGWFSKPLERAGPSFREQVERMGNKVRERWSA